MEEACRRRWQAVVLRDTTASSVFARMRLDLEDDRRLFECSVVWRQALLSPTEDDELALILFAELFKELPEVLNQTAILLIVTLILRIFSVAAEQVDVRLAIAADPSLQVIHISDVEHATWDNLLDATANGLHLLSSISKASFECRSHVVEALFEFNRCLSTLTITQEVDLVTVWHQGSPVEAKVCKHIS